MPGRVVYDWIDGTRSPADLFVDVGANVGSYTLLACSVRGARGICFEPVPLTYQRLLDNLRLNDMTERVRAFNLGLSDRRASCASPWARTA